MNETRYQENGFQLVIYHERRADTYVNCASCGKATFHVATVLDKWGEDQSLREVYHYCKQCGMMQQQTIREGRESLKRQTGFEQPPYELLVELLATARQQNGRDVTVMTINKRWWAPHRYPLAVGGELADDSPAPEAEHAVEDEHMPGMIPLPKYTPPQEASRSPFRSRRRNAEDEPEADSEDD